MSKQISKIVYSCSGCSNLAQMANTFALNLEKENIAEMSCIAGVGAKIKPLVDVAKNADCIIALDGCGLGCTRECLNAIGLKPNLYFNLSDYGIKKEKRSFVNPIKANSLYNLVKDTIIDYFQKNRSV